eukprot:5146188-Prymnesium_polylepis.1
MHGPTSRCHVRLPCIARLLVTRVFDLPTLPLVVDCQPKGHCDRRAERRGDCTEDAAADSSDGSRSAPSGGGSGDPARAQR